jgi:hypothetical protein
LRVAPEDLGVAGERVDALLDPGAARVVEPDQGHAELERHVHHLADLAGVHLAQRAADDGEVLAEEVDRPALDQRVPGDDAVAEELLLLHAEIGAAVRREAVELDEGALVDEELDPLARGQLALLVLRGDALGAAAGEREGAHALQALERGFGGGLAHRDGCGCGLGVGGLGVGHGRKAGEPRRARLFIRARNSAAARSAGSDRRLRAACACPSS